MGMIALTHDMKVHDDGTIRFEWPDTHAVEVTPNGKGLQGKVRLAAYRGDTLIKTSTGLIQDADSRLRFALHCQTSKEDTTPWVDYLQEIAQALTRKRALVPRR